MDFKNNVLVTETHVSKSTSDLYTQQTIFDISDKTKYKKISDLDYTKKYTDILTMDSNDINNQFKMDDGKLIAFIIKFDSPLKEKVVSSTYITDESNKEFMAGLFNKKIEEQLNIDPAIFEQKGEHNEHTTNRLQD